MHVAVVRMVWGCFAGASVLCVSACSSPRSAPATWVDPQTEVAVFGPEGDRSPGRSLGEEIYGIGAGKHGMSVDWDRVSAALDASRHGPRDVADAALGDGEKVQDAERGQDPEPGGASQDPGEPQDPEAAERARIDAEAARQEDRRRAEARLRIAFGDSILIRDDGSITKQYFLSQGASNVFTSLLMPIGADEKAALPPTQEIGGEHEDSVLGRMLGADNPISILFISDFESFTGMAPRAGTGNAPAEAKVPGSNSLVLVTARPKALAAFENALNLFYANIPQVEIQVKVVEYATADAISFGIRPIDNNTVTLQNLSSGRLIQQITSSFPLSPPLSGSGSTTDRGLITLGGIHDTWQLNAVLEALETASIADIKSQPTMVVRNGGLATVSTLTQQPFPKARISNQTVVLSEVEFKPVGVVMDIRPEIAGTETVVLNIYVSVSAVTGFAPTEGVATPIVATREATTSVHLRDGESTVIGGLVSESVFDAETKLPILGDIPILGYLFRSTTTQKQSTSLEFHITPRILWGTRGTVPSGTGF